MKLFLSEHFISIQGEGARAGRTSLFVRTTGCNMRCHWCDTPYTSWNPKGERYELGQVAEVIRTAVQSGVRDLVITGGEPMLQAKAIDALLGGTEIRLSSRDWPHTTMETNGTLYTDQLINLIDLWSVSPKLVSSAPASGPERDQHLQVMDAYDKSLPWFVERANVGRAQFKYVIQDAVDIEEVALQVERYSIPQHSIWLMPEGRGAAEVTARMKLVMDAARERRWNCCTRLHTLAYGAARGV